MSSKHDEDQSTARIRSGYELTGDQFSPQTMHIQQSYGWLGEWSGYQVPEMSDKSPRDLDEISLERKGDEGGMRRDEEYAQILIDS